jgi:hypothetical protein
MRGTGERTLSRNILLFILGICLTACSGGGSTGTPAAGTITGVVRDMTTGSPVAGATVSDGTTSTATDSQGTFTLQRPAGSCTLTASAAGYETTSRAASVTSKATTVLNWALVKAHAAYVNYSGLAPSLMIPAASQNYVILAWNDLGMHCMQDDYSYALFLPPFNTLHAQVIQRGRGVVTSGITVSYAFPNKTNSALHTNFWNYSSRYNYAQYGWKTVPNVGITGTPLAGTMALDGNGLGFVATGIPLTPYDDDGTWDPYGTATITVRNSVTGAILATTEVVAPVSSEINCSNCHGTINPFLNILQVHDRRSGTTLVADRNSGLLHLCSECHADNALGLPGKTGVKNLSLAVHGFHKDKINVSADPRDPNCYNCHPGPKTNCMRGVMYHADKSCSDCHGDMSGMTNGLLAGRQPWLQEPRCGDCHAATHQENAGTLFRNSVLTNTPGTRMNGKLYCEGCHNSTHAEFTSTNTSDNIIPQQLQGDNYWIWNCYVCHNDYMPMPSLHQ